MKNIVACMIPEENKCTI